MLTSAVNVEASTKEKVKNKKRRYSARSPNWRDITQNFMTFKNQERTMTIYGLQLENNASEEEKAKNYLRWNTTLNRWKKEVFSQDDHLKKGNQPPYGKEIDDEQ
jgi:hypothetical protein